MSGATSRRAGLVRGVLTPVAIAVSPAVGPTRWRRFAVRARLEQAATLESSDPAGALRLVRPVLDSGSAPADVWSLAFRLAAASGGATDALDFARRSVRSGRPELSLLLAYRKLASEGQDEEHVEHAWRAIASHVPTSQKELDDAAGALRYASLDHVETFLRSLSTHPDAATLSDEAGHEAVDELRLIEAHRSDPHRYTAVRDEVLTDRRRPLRVLASALRRLKAWPELAAVVETADSDPAGATSGEQFPVWIVSKAASGAFTSGYTAAAASLARAVLARRSDSAMAALLAEAEDELAIERDGWRNAEPGKANADAYERRPAAVLSVLGQSLPIRSGGYATRSHGIITGLAHRGWDMRAVTRLGFPFDLWWKADDPRWPQPFDVVDGIEYHRLLHDGVRSYPRHPLAEYVADGADGIARVARDHGASLIHASSLYDVGLAGVAAARRIGVPFVYEMRGLKQLLEEARKPEFAGSDRDRYLDTVEMAVVAEADAVFVITAALGDELVRMGADPDRLAVVPNGVHVDRFTPRARDTELESELGVAGKTVVGYVGGLVHYEGLELLLEAAAELARERDDFHVLIVGDGAHERALLARAAALGTGDYVTFTGRVPHEQVERYLSLVDVAPFPRLPLRVCELISPIKPFEAMAMGKAVVVSDVAALSEIVTDGDTGRVFAKGDAADLRRVLAELLDAPDERGKLGEASRVWVRRERDWSTITATVDAAYRSLLGDAAPART